MGWRVVFLVAAIGASWDIFVVCWIPKNKVFVSEILHLLAPLTVMTVKRETVRLNVLSDRKQIDVMNHFGSIWVATHFKRNFSCELYRSASKSSHLVLRVGRLSAYSCQSCM